MVANGSISPNCTMGAKVAKVHNLKDKFVKFDIQLQHVNHPVGNTVNVQLIVAKFYLLSILLRQNNKSEVI
jgi:hypothetical protein